jgi:hypothetical protein
MNYIYDDQMFFGFITTIRFRSIEVKLKEPCNSFFGIFTQPVSPVAVRNLYRKAVDCVKKDREKLVKKILEDDIFETELEEYLQGGSTPGLRTRIYQQLFEVNEALELEGHCDS